MSTHQQVRIGNEVITEYDHEVEGIRSLEPRWLEYYGLRRGDVVYFETVEETVHAETRREWGHGYTGQEREIVTGRECEVVGSESRKLWHTSKRGWYWL